MPGDPNPSVLAQVLSRLDQIEQAAARRHVFTEALLNIFTVLQPRAPLPAFEGSRIAPDCAKILLNCIFDRRPSVMVEFGGGVSTLVAGYAMQKLGRGRIVSVEHDPAYFPALQDNIRRHGLESIVTAVEAPLEPLTAGRYSGPLADPQGGPPHTWYRREAWTAALRRLEVSDQPRGGAKVDLVFVDGPGGGLYEPLSRWPALPGVLPFLAPDAVVVLDDANRPGEAQCLRAWQRDFADFKADPVVKTLKGTAILRRGANAAPK